MIRKLTIPALAAAMMIGSAGLALAQSSAPIPTGSAGNSNTGPGAKPMGATATPTTGRRTKASRASRNTPVRANTPMPTGSAGNSNTGPGAKPPQ
jgi:hypothetical protein